MKYLKTGFNFLAMSKTKVKPTSQNTQIFSFRNSTLNIKKMTIIRDFQNAIYFSTLILIAVLKYRSGIPEALQLCHLSDA